MDELFSAMRGLAACIRATEFCRQAMARFHTACATGDWAAAEVVRGEIIAAMESYLSELMSAQRAAQRAAQGIRPDGGER